VPICHAGLPLCPSVHGGIPYLTFSTVFTRDCVRQCDCNGQMSMMELCCALVCRLHSDNEHSSELSCMDRAVQRLPLSCAPITPSCGVSEHYPSCAAISGENGRVVERCNEGSSAPGRCGIFFPSFLWNCASQYCGVC
jgi:hypothetical protein